MSTPIIQVECLKHVYPDQTVVSICGLDFVVNQGAVSYTHLTLPTTPYV